MQLKIEDTPADTEKATQKWDGRTSSHETLYRTDDNRYYIVHTSPPPRAEFVLSEAVIKWLLLNGYELPAEFKGGNGRRSH